MADDNRVDITFAASTDDVLSGIGDVRDGLASLTAPVEALRGSLGGMAEAFGAALPADKIAQSASALSNVATAAKVVADNVKDISFQMRLGQIQLSEQKTLLDAEVSQFKITQDQKFALLEAETRKEYDAELELLNRKMLLGDLDTKQQEKVHEQILLLTEKRNAALLRLDEQSIAAQQALWDRYLSTVTGAFNSQLRGLLEGTTSWQKATRKMLEDLTIKFIEMAEQMVVKWLAAEIAQTTATTTGAAARAAAEQAAADSGILANAANAVKAIMTDAAQTFAGVFAFLAPTMGPAAAGPAAAAQASVAAVAVFDAGTDYVVRGGLALIHPGRARLRSVHRRERGAGDPCAGQHHRLGARFAKRGALLQRQLQAHAARHQRRGEARRASGAASGRAGRDMMYRILWIFPVGYCRPIIRIDLSLAQAAYS